MYEFCWMPSWMWAMHTSYIATLQLLLNPAVRSTFSSKEPLTNFWLQVCSIIFAWPIPSTFLWPCDCAVGITNIEPKRSWSHAYLTTIQTPLISNNVISYLSSTLSWKCYINSLQWVNLWILATCNYATYIGTLNSK